MQNAVFVPKQLLFSRHVLDSFFLVRDEPLDCLPLELESSRLAKLLTFNERLSLLCSVQHNADRSLRNWNGHVV